MSIEEKLAFLEEIMEADEGTLLPETCLDDVDEWDSLAALSLITEMKSRFKIELTSAVIRSFATVGDICAYIPD